MYSTRWPLPQSLQRLAVRRADMREPKPCAVEAAQKARLSEDSEGLSALGARSDAPKEFRNACRLASDVISVRARLALKLQVERRLKRMTPRARAKFDASMRSLLRSFEPSLGPPWPWWSIMGSASEGRVCTKQRAVRRMQAQMTLARARLLSSLADQGERRSDAVEHLLLRGASALGATARRARLVGLFVERRRSFPSEPRGAR